MGYYKARISVQTFSYRFRKDKDGQELDYKNRLQNEIIIVDTQANCDYIEAELELN